MGRALLLSAVIGLSTVMSGAVASTGSGTATTSTPNVFAVRLEGYAVEVNTFSTATAVTPRTAYSFAKVGSVRAVGGKRGLDLEARGANAQYAGLEGAVLFGGSLPTNGNNLPGYAQAFFPTFDGFSTIAEKCAANQTESREAPECRGQDGPYALARVVPDQLTPMAEGIGRNEGNDKGGDARSRSLIRPATDGSVAGLQSNSGSNQQVPGTPITVDSYVAEQSVVTRIGQATTLIRCAGKVSVAGQPVVDDASLQRALAPLTATGDLKVVFEPATEPTVEKLGGGALQATCRGPRFVVSGAVQGGSGIAYTFGWTFAALGVTENLGGTAGGDDAGGSASIGGGLPPLSSGSAAFEPPVTRTTATGAEAGTGSPPAAPSAGATEPAEAAPGEAAAPALAEPFGPTLVRQTIDATPIGLLTGFAAALLALGVWLLLGVTGSLARGLASLRLPPFRDGPLG